VGVPTPLRAHIGRPARCYHAGAVRIERIETFVVEAGTPPDIIQQEAAGAIGMIGKNPLLPVDAFLKRDKEEKR
jgi:hypothetical protein